MIRLDIKTKKRYAWFVSLLWAMNPILEYAVVLGSKMLFIGNYAVLIVVLFVSFFGISSYRYWSQFIKVEDIFLYLAISSLVIIEYALFPQNAEELSPLLLPSLLYTLPYLFVGLILEVRVIESAIYKISVVSIIVQLLYFFVFLRFLYRPEDNLVGDLIVPAYATLPHVLIVLWQMFRKANVFNVLISIVGIMLMLSFGNRGSIVGLLFFSVVYFFFISRQEKKWSFRLFFIVIVVLIYMYMDAIMGGVFNISQDLGMSAGLFDRYFNESLSDVNGRDVISRGVISHLYDSPVFGSGLASDRVFVGVYSHNLILEMLLSFGFLFGSLFLVLIFRLIIKAFFKAGTSVEKSFVALLSAMSIVKLMVSGSFIVEPTLFLLIGFCITTLRKKASLLET